MSVKMRIQGLVSTKNGKVFFLMTIVAVVMLFVILQSSSHIGVTMMESVGFQNICQVFTSGNNQQQAPKLSVYEARRQHVKETCLADKERYYPQLIKEDYSRFMLDDRNGLVFCSVPKIGCSFWKRVFSILDGPNRGAAVFNLSSTGIHRKGKQYGKLEADTFIQKYHFLQSSKKAVFARDPYERLFSGYIDKVFTPCVLATDTQKALIQMEKGAARKKNTGTNTTVIPSRQPQKQQQQQQQQKDPSICDPHVNFASFLRYVSTYKTVNDHFQKQHTFCLPCHVDFDFIGKMETFHKDADTILRSVGVDPASVYGPEESFEENSDLNIIHDVSERSFTACSNKKYWCTANYDMMRRTWTTLQIRGYLSVKIPFPLEPEKAGKTSLNTFLDLARQAYKRSGNHTVVKRQRTQAFLEAYYSVPKDILQKVREYVSEDCDLYGYDCDLNSRFNISNRPQPMFVFNGKLFGEYLL